MLGGHWLVLQTVAWSRMVVVFAAKDSLKDALVKTFDGKHPCWMCLQIQDGRAAERHHEKEAVVTLLMKSSDILAEQHPSIIPVPPAKPAQATPYVPCWRADFIQSPPTPPPKAAC